MYVSLTNNTYLQAVIPHKIIHLFMKLSNMMLQFKNHAYNRFSS